MARKLRIAVSVFFGVLTVALCVLWVRSYWVTDLISRMDPQKIATTLGSQYGAIYFAHFDAAIAYGQSSNSTAPRDWGYKSVTGYEANNGLFVWDRGATSLYAALPHWLIAIVTASIGAAPWLIFRFSLRTVFIATTLVAVMLGLTAWAGR